MKVYTELSSLSTILVDQFYIISKELEELHKRIDKLETDLLDLEKMDWRKYISEVRGY